MSTRVTAVFRLIVDLKSSPVLVSAYVSHCRYHNNLEKAKDMGIKKAFIANSAAGVNYLITYLTFALSFWYGCTLVMNDEYTIGNLLTVSTSVERKLPFHVKQKTVRL